MTSLARKIAGLVLGLALVGCSTLGGTPVEPLQPDDVRDLTMAATAVYLNQHPIPPVAAAKIRELLQTARGELTTETPNLGAAKMLLVDQLPPEWKPLGAAGLSILNRRVHLEELVKAGQTKLASQYVLAAIDGASDALAFRTGL